MALAALPSFEWLAGKPLETSLLFGPETAMALVAGALMAGLLAGAYPALILSGFRPLDTMRGRFFSPGRGIGFRKRLVVVQFGISLTLMVGTAVVFTQVKFMHEASLGFDSEQLVVLPFHGDPGVRLQHEVIKSGMLAIAGVSWAS
jgi:putative ABC transport system permease protein